MTFAQDLDDLIKQHIGHPKFGDDFQPIVNALHEATNRWAARADCYRLRNETKRQFEERRSGVYDLRNS
jgi:hypothetical protein